MDLKDNSHWVEMELLHLEVSAAFLHSHNHKKEEKVMDYNKHKLPYLFVVQTAVYGSCPLKLK